MSRDLKFRVWNTVLKKYVCPNVVEQKDGLWLNLGNEDNLYEFEQYTGLKDRNGKEIYEGDIIKVVNLHDGDEECWKQPYGPAIPQEVKWDEELLRWSFGGCGRILYAPEDFEVIGNIHEDSELLGGEE